MIIFRPIIRDIIAGTGQVPEFIEQPQDQTASTGESATFGAPATADNGNVEYQWQVDSGSGFVDIPGANSYLLSLLSLILAQNGNLYRCVAKANGRSRNSRAASLTVTGL